MSDHLYILRSVVPICKRSGRCVTGDYQNDNNKGGTCQGRRIKPKDGIWRLFGWRRRERNENGLPIGITSWAPHRGRWRMASRLTRSMTDLVDAMTAKLGGNKRGKWCYWRLQSASTLVDWFMGKESTSYQHTGWRKTQSTGNEKGKKSCRRESI